MLSYVPDLVCSDIVNYGFNMSCLVWNILGLGFQACSYLWRWSWSLHLVLGRPRSLLPVGLWFIIILGSLLSCILSTSSNHCFYNPLFLVLCFVTFSRSLISVFLFLSNLVSPMRCLKNFICAASSLYFSVLGSNFRFHI
jgi:hypothetical protein